MNLKGKRLLVLGGAAQCVKYIETAQKMGVYCIVTDISKNSPGKLIADQHLDFSVMDYDSLYNWCKENPVDGVVNFCVDFAQHTHQKLCDSLGFPSYGNELQVKYLTDKKAFKHLCVENHLDIIPEYFIEDIDKIQFPVLVKPAESSGSRGMSVCNTKEELITYSDYAIKNSRNGKLLIEKDFSGYDDIEITYYVKNGEPFLLCVADRYLGNKDDGLQRQAICQIAPSKYTDFYIEKINSKVCKMFQKIGLKNGPVFLQGFVDGETVRFYDPGIRFPGDEYGQILYRVTGINWAEVLVNYALNNTCELPEDSISTSYLLRGKETATLYITTHSGKISKFSGKKEVESIDGVVSFAQKAFVDDVIEQTGDVKQRVCEIALIADDKKKLVESINACQNSLSILDENGNDIIVSKFDANNVINN